MNLVDLLAVARLTRLVTADEITSDFRDWVETRWAGSKVAYLASCPWCVSAYAAAAVVWLRRRHPRLWQPIAEALALSMTTGTIAQIGDALEYVGNLDE